MVETVVAELGGLHIAVNNAGIIRNSPAEDTTEEEWDLTFAINTKGVFFSCQVLPTSIKEGTRYNLLTELHSLPQHRCWGITRGGSGRETT